MHRAHYEANHVAYTLQYIAAGPMAEDMSYKSNIMGSLNGGTRESVTIALYGLGNIRHNLTINAYITNALLKKERGWDVNETCVV